MVMNNALALKENPIMERFVDEDGWRFYLKNGKQYFSVTTILENTVANPKLMAWYKKNSENKIEKVKSQTAQFGTDGHALFEKILGGWDLGEVPESHKLHVENFRKWVDEHKVQALHCEIPLISEKYGFAGTSDFIGFIDGEPILADWKVTARYNIKNGWQLGAYRRAAIEMGLVDERCGLMGVQVDRNTAEIKTFKYQHIDFVEHAFMATLEIFKALYFHKLSKLDWPWLKERAI